MGVVILPPWQAVVPGTHTKTGATRPPPPPEVAPEAALALAVQGSRPSGQGHLGGQAGGCLWGQGVGVQGGKGLKMP